MTGTIRPGWFLYMRGILRIKSLMPYSPYWMGWDGRDKLKRLSGINLPTENHHLETRLGYYASNQAHKGPGGTQMRYEYEGFII